MKPSPGTRALRAAACVGGGLLVLATPVPAGVDPEGWRVLAVFVAVILGLVLQPFAMGPTVLLGVVACAASGGLPFDALVAGWGEKVVWLVVGAFLLAGAVRDTGLGRRVALLLVRGLGRSTLGLGYAEAAAELLLGPIVPSNTARGGGILAPVSESISRALGSEPGGNPERAGAYLSLVGAHANLIAAGMFLTGMAANPMLVQAARDVYGIEVDWATWATATIVPGLLALLLLPPFLYALVRPTVTDARPARAMAAAELERMGPWSRREVLLAATFVVLLLLWSLKAWGGWIGIERAPDTTLVAFLGIAALLVLRVQDWGRMTGDAAAWDTLIWLGGLLSLANGLKALGVVDWFAGAAEGWFDGAPMLVVLLGLALVYFYSMYAFSMLTAHISAMAAAFLLACHGASVPALLAVPLFAVFSNLCGCTTNYSSGPIIVYFGLGYVPSSTWFRIGFLVSLFHLAVWIPAGLLWWRLLGWW